MKNKKLTFDGKQVYFFLIAAIVGFTAGPYLIPKYFDMMHKIKFALALTTGTAIAFLVVGALLIIIKNRLGPIIGGFFFGTGLSILAKLAEMGWEL